LFPVDAWGFAAVASDYHSGTGSALYLLAATGEVVSRRHLAALRTELDSLPAVQAEVCEDEGLVCLLGFLQSIEDIAQRIEP
jgi:hypothetical protein